MSPTIAGIDLPEIDPSTGDTPPSVKVKETISNTHRRLNSVCEAMARVETRIDETDSRYRVLEAQGKMVIGGLSVVGALIVAVAGWLVSQQDEADKRAREVAEIVAEKTVLAADRKLDERIKLALDANNSRLIRELNGQRPTASRPEMAAASPIAP